MSQLRLNLLLAGFVTVLSAAGYADLGAAKSFVVLSSGSQVSFHGRVQINKAPSPEATTCPAAAGCTARIGGSTIAVGGEEESAGGNINADLVASGRLYHEEDDPCEHEERKGLTICLASQVRVAGACVTGGGQVSHPGDCSNGVDVSGTNPEVSTLLPDARTDAAAFAGFLSSLPPSQTLAAISHRAGSLSIHAQDGLNVIAVPSIHLGDGASLTITGSAAALVIVNVGSGKRPGTLLLGKRGAILLSGGITADKVVFNVAGGGRVTLGGQTVFHGTILAPAQSLSIGNEHGYNTTTINGALLFGGRISVRNRLVVNFFPLATIAQPVALTVVGTVNINDLPPPVIGNGNNESDDFESAPHIEDVPGRPAPPAAGSRLLLAHGVAGPQKLTAPIPPLAPAASDVVQTPIEFTGLGNGNSKVPPDTQLAAGNTRLIEMVNVSGAEYGKLSGNLIKSFDLGSMFLTSKGQGTDPRVVFDAIGHTYYAAYELKTAGGDEIRLAVAEEPGDSWTIYEVRSNNVDTCFDQPKLGYSLGVVTLSWNDYKNAKSCSSLPGSNFTGSEYIVIQKIGLLLRRDSVPAVVWGPDSSRFQIVPAQSLSSAGTQYAMYRNIGSSNINVMAFEGIPGIFDVSFSENSFNIGSVSGPPAASQPSGGDASVATNDDRLLSAVWQNDSLWGAFNESCTPGGDNTARACERFVNVSTRNNSVSQNVQLQSSGQDLYYAALTLTGTGDLFFGMTFSSSSLNPSAVLLGVPHAAFGAVTGGVIYQSGSKVYTCGCGKGNSRWGDYSGAASDPNDPTVAWVAQEYSLGDWGTAITAAFFGTPPPPPPPR